MAGCVTGALLVRPVAARQHKLPQYFVSNRCTGLRVHSGATRLSPFLLGDRFRILGIQSVRGTRHCVCSSARNAAGDQKADEAERSDLVNEQLLLFIFQQELDTQLQRALNVESFDVAKQIREKREQIDEAVAEFESTKQGRSGSAATSSSDVRDTVSEGLMLRSELQKAVEEENYAEAARIRDQLAELEESASSLQADLEKERWDTAPPLFQIGQRFVHATKGYKGVIAGWDRTCCEDDEWRERAQVSRLARRENQPFYHVLVDQNESQWDSQDRRPPVAYVAEELVKVPKEQTWAEAHGSAGIRHPYAYVLFFGQDGEGNYIPVSQLREYYGQERRDVYIPGKEDDEEDDGNTDGDGDKDGDSPKGPSTA